MRVDLGEIGEVPVHADFDGRFWVGTFADTQDAETGEWQPARIVAVDTSSATPTPIDVACPPGATGTIDRLGVPAPVTPSTTTPPTTTAPTTTQPATAGQCDGVRVHRLRLPDSQVRAGLRRPTHATDARAAGIRRRDRRLLRPGDRTGRPPVPAAPPDSRSTGSSARTPGRRCTRISRALSMATAAGSSTRGRCPPTAPSRARRSSAPASPPTARG